MVTTLGALYVVGVTVLFFFWVYGIYAFVRDLRNRWLPALREHRAQQREQDEREEREQQLY